MTTGCLVELDTVTLAHLQSFICKFNHKNGDGERRKEGSERECLPGIFVWNECFVLMGKTWYLGARG